MGVDLVTILSRREAMGLMAVGEAPIMCTVDVGRGVWVLVPVVVLPVSRLRGGVAYLVCLFLRHVCELALVVLALDKLCRQRRHG